MTQFPVEEPPRKTDVKLRIKYNRTTIIVLNILLTIKKLCSLLAVLLFLGDTIYMYMTFIVKQVYWCIYLRSQVSVYRTIGPLVFYFNVMKKAFSWVFTYFIVVDSHYRFTVINMNEMNELDEWEQAINKGNSVTRVYYDNNLIIQPLIQCTAINISVT